MLAKAIRSSRFVVYLLCTLATVITAYWLGKEMQWDTLDYHLYAGFSALHDRFGLDYFAAAPQSYLNPYAYLPFYLLATSGLTALGAAAIMAVLQSAIFWLTYELAAALVAPDRPRMRIVVGACAAALAFANPVLVQQLGSSFADVTTGELVLAGWLMLIRAVRKPSTWALVGAGLLLGAASALKLTNSLDAVSIAIVPLFVPVPWRKRIGSLASLGLCVTLGFALVSLPWSIQLERRFGNPFFPLLNGIFRSPEFTTAPVIDFRFIPTSFAAALWRPFAIAAPIRLVHVETSAADLRYAFLAILGALLIMERLWHRSVRGKASPLGTRRSAESRMLLALGCAFLFNWVIWLRLSGNSRYFIPMACVAAVLAVSVMYRLLGAWPRLCACALVAMLGAQVYQVGAGTAFRPPLPWERTAWFDVSVPQALASQSALYLSVGIQSSSFVVPFLARGSGFINLEGDYVLGPDGANGVHIRQLINQFSPRVRVLVSDTRVVADHATDVPHLDDVDDAVEPFGLRVDPSQCVRIVARYTPTVQVMTFERQIPNLPLSRWYTGYLVSCQLVPDHTRGDADLFRQYAPNVALDRLEDACPELFQPRRPVTFVVGNPVHGYSWVRRYSNTDVLAWVHDKRVKVQRIIGGGRQQDAGSALAWEKTPLQVQCGWEHTDVFLRVLPPR